MAKKIRNSPVCPPRGFLRDEQGTVTIEFLLWMPLLAFWMMGSVAFFDAYKTRNDVSKAAHALSDILSRQVEVSDGFFDELYSLQAKLLPRVVQGNELRVTSIQYQALDDTYHVIWSKAFGGDQPMTAEFIPIHLLPEMADLDTVILTEVAAPYRPVSNWTLIDSNEWSFVLVSRPRFVSAIAKID